MSLIQVRSAYPQRVYASPQAPVTIKNLGATPVFYGTEQNVSSVLKTGELVENASVELSQPTYVIAKSPAAVGTNIIGSLETVLEIQPVVGPLRREIYIVNGVLLESEAVGTYFPVATGGAYLKATALKATSAENAFAAFWFDPATWTITGKQLNLLLDLIVLTDNVAPTASILSGLYKLASTEAAEKKLELTFEAVVAGSNAAQVTTPGAKTINHATAIFPAPTTAGVYALGIETITATTAAKSFEAVTTALYAT